MPFTVCHRQCSCSCPGAHKQATHVPPPCVKRMQLSSTVPITAGKIYRTGPAYPNAHPFSIVRQVHPAVPGWVQPCQPCPLQTIMPTTHSQCETISAPQMSIMKKNGNSTHHLSKLLTTGQKRYVVVWYTLQRTNKKLYWNGTATHFAGLSVQIKAAKPPHVLLGGTMLPATQHKQEKLRKSNPSSAGCAAGTCGTAVVQQPEVPCCTNCCCWCAQPHHRRAGMLHQLTAVTLCYAAEVHLHRLRELCKCLVLAPVVPAILVSDGSRQAPVHVLGPT